jgi:translation elongation factor EF-1alpha
MLWYDGPTLREVIETRPDIDRSVFKAKEIRIAILDSFKVKNTENNVYVGQLITGELMNSTDLLLKGSGASEKITVGAVKTLFNQEVLKAVPGDFVAFSQSPFNIDPSYLISDG